MTDPITQTMIQGAAGAGGEGLYVEEVFKTYLWTGNGASNRGIVNNIDIANEGGMVWIKARTGSDKAGIYDTIRGAGYLVCPSNNAGQATETYSMSQFNNNGFNVDNNGITNQNNVDYASWTFRKAKGFFDVVTWTGNATAGRTIAHSLGSVPGMIMVKKTGGADDWVVGHRKLNGGSNDWNYGAALNQGVAKYASTTLWNNTAPSSTHITLGGSGRTNENGQTYIAYIFAHNDESFGEKGNQSIIKCGYYTTDGNEEATIDLGWEPDFLITKRTDSNTGGDWYMIDSMRGWSNAQNVKANNGKNQYFQPNLQNTENQGTYHGLTSTGFFADQFGANRPFIYMAIRRPDGYVGKPLEVGTEAFAIDTGNGSTTTPNFTSNFPVDMAINRTLAQESWYITARKSVIKYMITNGSNSESVQAGYEMDSNVGWGFGSFMNSSKYSWMWRRHKGFDVVTWLGRVTHGPSNITHGLAQAPEMMITKRRDAPNQGWYVYHKDLDSGNSPQSHYLELNDGAGEGGSSTMWDNKQPTETQAFFNGSVNSDGQFYLSYLFSSVPGISKCGTWTGDGTSNNSLAITLGFSPRFVITKRADGSSNWLVIDTVRGFTKYMRIQTDGAESTQTFLTATATGFTLNSSDSDVNTSGAKYIYYAHA